MNRLSRSLGLYFSGLSCLFSRTIPYLYVLFLASTFMLTLNGCTREAEKMTSVADMSMCIPGNEGCECKSDGQCNTLAGEEMVCLNNQCVLPQDNPNPNMPTPMQVGLGVSSDQARGCEMVIIDPEYMIQKIQFDSTLKGQWMRRNEHVAIAFFTQNDQAIRATALSIESTRLVESLQTTNVKCVDRVGTPIPGATIFLN